MPPLEIQVAAALRWLALHARPGSRQRPAWSYELKHAVQGWAGHYVSGPAFVEAARRAGFAIVRATPSGNAWIAMRSAGPIGAVPSRRG